MTKDRLSKNEIIKLLPHREPMLLIDELINIKHLHSATAIMNVKKNSFYVDGHFPGNPVLPGVLIVAKIWKEFKVKLMKIERQASRPSIVAE